MDALRLLFDLCTNAEINYKELDANPMFIMWRIYRRLNFWPFVRARGRFRRYLISQENYQKNSFQISLADVENVNLHWEFAFREWGYFMQPTE